MAPPASPAGGPQAVPDRIGPYVVRGLIGEGGMAVVYQARHEDPEVARSQGGDVALKVMHPELGRSSSFRTRFEREAALGMRLQHPGIVRTHEMVSDGERLGLVMELVLGRPLEDVIGEVTGPIPWERSQPMLLQLLDTLSYAHEQGVVHRDVKPANLILTLRGELRVLDFGIAKHFEGDDGHTRTGTAMGSSYYMAPEQHLDAKSVDGRADIYALGMTLYEMLAGHLPWSEDPDPVALLVFKQKGEIQPPTEFYPDIPPAVVALVMEMLAAQPADRPDSMAGLAHRVRQLGSAPSPGPEERPPAAAAARRAAEPTLPSAPKDSRAWAAPAPVGTARKNPGLPLPSEQHSPVNAVGPLGMGSAPHIGRASSTHAGRRLELTVEEVVKSPIVTLFLIVVFPLAIILHIQGTLVSTLRADGEVLATRRFTNPNKKQMQGEVGGDLVEFRLAVEQVPIPGKWLKRQKLVAGVFVNGRFTESLYFY